MKNIVPNTECWDPALNNMSTQLFSCEYYEILKNSFFTEHLRWVLKHCVTFSLRVLVRIFCYVLVFSSFIRCGYFSSCEILCYAVCNFQCVLYTCNEIPAK